MRFTRILVLFFFLMLTFTWLFSTGAWKKLKADRAASSPVEDDLSRTTYKKLQQKAVDAKTFIRQKGFNRSVCLMIDMSLHSGQGRFFVYDLVKDTIINTGLVTHGRCNQNWLEGRKYGNSIGCGCTSLGKYRVGHAYTGKFGLAYKLYGLDSSNNNAFKRYVVLHSHECVPETDVKDEICQSDGCPTVSPGFLQYLKPIINTSKKPLLLWIYE